MNWSEAYALLDGPKAHKTCRANGYKNLANNTRLYRFDVDESSEYTYTIKLHATHILHFFKDGRVRIDAKNWKTVTTKDRLNRFLPAGWSISQQYLTKKIGSVWFLYGPRGKNGRERYWFENGITINPDGTVSGEGEDLVAKSEDAKKEKSAKREEEKKLYADMKLDKGSAITYLVVCKERVPGMDQEQITTNTIEGREIKFPIDEFKDVIFGFGPSYYSPDTPRGAGESRWAVTELRTGLSIASGKTKSEAAVSAYRILQGCKREAIDTAVADVLGTPIKNFARALAPPYAWYDAPIDLKTKSITKWEYRNTKFLPNEDEGLLAVLSESVVTPDQWDCEMFTYSQDSRKSVSEHKSDEREPFLNLDSAKKFVEIAVKTKGIYEKAAGE